MSLLRYFLPAALLTSALAPVAVAQHVPLPDAVRLTAEAKSASDRPTLLGVPTEQYNHGDPTALEQYLLEMINRARANPTAEGHRLVTTNDPNVRAAFNFFNVDTALVRAQFASYPSRPPLAFNAALIAAARRHTADMVANDFQGHVGTDGSTFDQRIVAAGYTGWTGAGENVSSYASNIWYAHAGFNVDWGVPNLGHRHNIMNFEATDHQYTEFGAGVTDLNRPPQANKVGPVVVTETFGNARKPFVTGVVYNDANANGFYDVGEGLAGVKVMPSSGRYYAVTSTSGGYAIPIENAGTSFTVTFSEGPLASSHTRDVTITNNQSVKLDLAPTAAPGPVTTISPAASAVVTTTGPRFTWRRPVVGTDRYRVQIATDAGMTALVVNDSTIADTTAVFSGLVDGTTYYWRVQAHNGAGWGELAAPQSFRVVMLPAAVTLVSPADDGRVPRDNALFTWSRPSPTVTAYAFELANDAGFTSIVASDTAVTDTSYLVTSLGLDRYFWRVRAKNAAGWGPYSEVREVEAATSGVDGEAGAHGASELGVAVYPNPAAATTTARVDLPRSGRYGIDLVDVLGRVVFDVTALDGRREWPAGSYEIMLDLNTLQQGLYFVRVTAEDGTSAVTPVRVVTGR